MPSTIAQHLFDRRTVLKGAAAAGALQVASPFIIAARGETPIRIGMVDPLTGVYAAVAQNEVIGAKLAVEQINAKGGILGRPIELLVEDSANDVGTGVQKTRKLIERDQVSFIIGDVNSGIAQAIAQVTAEKKVLHVVSGGHTDSITGKDCKWNVYRVCNTTRMEANSVSDLLFSKYGKKWHFITPDYAFGHTLYEACAANLKKLGGTITGNELTPLGTSDFSAYLIKARAANPDVLLLLPQGSDMVNCLKQIVQFGINKQIHVAGTQQELESLEVAAAGSPHRHLDVRMVLETTEYAAPRGVRRRHPQAHRRQGADRAHLVRLHLGLHLRAGGQSREDTRFLEARSGARRFRAAARGQAAAQQSLLSRGRSSAHDLGFRRRGPVQGQATPRICSRSTRSWPATRPRLRSPTPAASCNGRRDEVMRPLPLPACGERSISSVARNRVRGPLQALRRAERPLTRRCAPTSPRKRGEVDVTSSSNAS